jgi:hypothetical protein
MGCNLQLSSDASFHPLASTEADEPQRAERAVVAFRKVSHETRVPSLDGSGLGSNRGGNWDAKGPTYRWGIPWILFWTTWDSLVDGEFKQRSDLPLLLSENQEKRRRVQVLRHGRSSTRDPLKGHRRRLDSETTTDFRSLGGFNRPHHRAFLMRPSTSPPKKISTKCYKPATNRV